ncbi:hypothetical protein DFQ27_002013 [Actinomortierella ambigua]|uniref:DUF590-domain-containing protein n=1 Tax=Actinomortierella ambigua TaxID=1343610 RepID=A0A9P6U7U7_9FUNG|nr:hypothetical protein DFQ27_002013 [Actinomortierella ambigua]
MDPPSIQSHAAQAGRPFEFFDVYSRQLQQSNSALGGDAGSSTRATTSGTPPTVYADYVLVFRYPLPLKSQQNDKAELETKAIDAYKQILVKLQRAGLRYESRPGKKNTVHIFILCPWHVLKREVIRNNIQDWLVGVKVADTAEAEAMLQPAQAPDNSLDDLSEADRLRIVYQLLTNLPKEGGAGLYPGHDEHIESILPIHDKQFNKAWLKSWSTKWIVDQKDLSKIRDHFGERIAYYFEFLQFYFQWLAFPTGLGVLVHYFGSSFSIFYGITVVLWSAFFTESWKKREKELALWWGVRHVSRSETRRPGFHGEAMTDPVTGEVTPFFSPYKRWQRKITGVPVIVGGALVLSMVITSVFAIEVFLTLYYEGPMKDILVFLPLVLYSLAIPNVAAICKSVAKRLTDYENYETHGSYDYHLMQKVFIFNALTSYMSILLTAYVYIPFGPRVITTAQAYGLSFAKASIEPQMLQNRLRAFMMTTQAVSLATETIVPWLTRRALARAATIQTKAEDKLRHRDHDSDSDENESHKADASASSLGERADIVHFLNRVQKQVELPEYDVNEDYAEMVLQFGYVSLFSVIWPLTGLCAFVNNWVELRSDAAKISYNARRPIPARVDTIGPWLDNMQHISWFSSLTNASILYLFHGTTDSPRLSLGFLLLCMLVSEHGYLALRNMIGQVLESVPTKAEVDVRKKEYGVKSSWLHRVSQVLGGTASLAETNGGGAIGGSDGLEKRGLVDLTGPEVAALLLEDDEGAQSIHAAFKTT